MALRLGMCWARMIGPWAVLALSMALATSPADAQLQRPPPAPGPAATIDLSVLEWLGPPQNVPRILSSNPPASINTTRDAVSWAGGNRIVLKPPSRARKTTRRPVAQIKPRAHTIQRPRVKPPMILKPQVREPKLALPKPAKLPAIAVAPVPAHRLKLRPPAGAKQMARSAPQLSERPAPPRMAIPYVVAPQSKPVTRSLYPSPHVAKGVAKARPVRQPSIPRNVPVVSEPLDPRIAAALGKAGRDQGSPVPATAPTRTASLPKSVPKARKVLGLGSHYRLEFGSGASELDRRASLTLDKVVDDLKLDGRLRLQLLAYAGGRENTPSQSRRLSLSRALSVRSYLIDKGVRSTRIDVRALGSRYKDGPPNRVDAVVTKR